MLACLFCVSDGQHAKQNKLCTTQGNRTCSSKLQQQQQQQENGVEARGAPVSRVHVDYTTKSGPIRLKAALPDEAEQLMRTPFAVIQVNFLFPVSASQCPSCTSLHTLLLLSGYNGSVANAPFSMQLHDGSSHGRALPQICQV